MREKAMAANRRLAELLGWTNIFDVGGALLGTPPVGESACRGQAKVPGWTDDWRDCGPLIAQYRMTLSSTALDAIARCRAFDSRPGVAAFADFETEDEAMRSAIVAAVVANLEAVQK